MNDLITDAVNLLLERLDKIIDALIRIGDALDEEGR